MEPLDYAQYSNVVHWRAVLALVNTFDEAGRKIVQNGTVPTARGLPLGLRYKPAEGPAHDGAWSGIGSIDKVWFEGSKLMGQGRFDLDDPLARDVVRKIKMGFVRHVSADMLPGKEWKLAAATVLDIPTFEEAQFTAINIPEPVVVLDSESQVLEDQLVAFAFAVVGDMDLPLAPRDRAWDSSEAVGRVAEWSRDGDGDINPARFRRAFFYQDEGSDPGLLGSYKLPFADVIDGELHAVPRGLFAVAGGRGVDATDIPSSDKETVRRRVTAWYRKMAEEFDDPSLVSPWASDDGEGSYSVLKEDVSVREEKPVSFAAEATVAQARAAQALWQAAGVL